jgi:hypothetical protein
MHTSPSFFHVFKIATKVAGIALLSFAITDCASTKKGYAVLKAKQYQATYQRGGFENPLLRIEKDLVQNDFKGKLRSTMDGGIFQTNSWSSNCDCR